MTVKLNKPYFHEASAAKRWRLCAIISAFVFLFLFIFRPFGLNLVVGGDVLAITLGYGIACFAIMAFLNILLVALIPGFFEEEKWTTGREFGWSALNLFSIGLANSLYTIFIGIGGFNLKTFLNFELYTLAIGIFPIGVSILMVESRQSKKYKDESDSINKNLKSQDYQKVPETKELVLKSEGGNEDLSLTMNDLLYVKSADNYVDVYFLRNGEMSHSLIRSTIKLIQDSLDEEDLFRCHKSYLVNLNKVERISGNAQGLKIHLPGIENQIPVSRSLNDTIRRKLAS
jgi:hypothetical protein